MSAEKLLVIAEILQVNIGKYLYESFGQYDTYTTLQLARYVSTIANGGYLIQPHLVSSILQSSTINSKRTVDSHTEYTRAVQLDSDE